MKSPGIALLLLAVSGAMGMVNACSVPVFRYALDRWPADKYRLEISARDSTDEAVARFLRNFTEHTPINVEIARVPGESRLLFPDGTPVWTGDLRGNLAALADSPARTEIVGRILQGDSGVWVLVESGRPDADAKAASLLEKRLRYLEQVAQLPHIDPTDPTSKLGPGPALTVRFSLVRIPHGASAEEDFVKMLAGSKRAPAQPWFGVVFGRGRTLGAWAADGFGEEQIDEACLFLLGACSCQVKRMNPGWDLLLNVDWDEKLRGIGLAATAKAQEDPPCADAPESLPSESRATETVKIEPAAGPAPLRPAAASSAMITPMGLSAVALLVLGLAAAWWKSKGRRT